MLRRHAQSPQLPTDEGAFGSLLRSFDWSRTPLGALETWPASLRAMAAMVLENRFPMNLLWGRDLLHIYNEAYVPVLGGKHPAALGRPAPEVWSEIWPIIGPQMERVLSGLGATWNDKLLLPMNRQGFLEETYFTFSYSPVRDDGGGIGGVLVTCQETTADVQGERQLQMLRDLGAQLTLTSAQAACAAAAEILERNDADIPFALIYLLERSSEDAVLAARSGLAGYEGPAAVQRVSSSRLDEAPWPLFDAQPGKVHVVSALRERVGRLPEGRWGTPDRAVIVALGGSGQAKPYGYLVAGVSPARALDDRYEELFRLTADQVARGLARVFAYEEERQRAEALAALDRAKSVFFSNVSHELRTPLALMLGPLADARAEPRGALGGAALDMVHRNALRLLKLVNGLLDFARIEAGRAVARHEPTDLPRLTADLASAFRSAIERAGLALRVDCSPLPAPVAVDREMWEKIVLNLLSNALKFTFEGGIAIHLRETGGFVELVVEDTGTGIAPDELPLIFERFHRSSHARARTHEGTGIGLSLVHELVKLHGGEISVESKLGKGSKFKVKIPFGCAPREAAESARPIEASSLETVPYVEEALGWISPSNAQREPWMPGSKLAAAPLSRVLVADDNADMRAYLAQLLGQQSQVECAADGNAALAAALSRPPDLVLADVMMPGLDGFELLRRLRSEPATREIPVILLSARAGEEARIEGIQAGADDYLIKPFSGRELRARVQMQLSLQRVRRAGMEAIRASEARFRALVTASSDVIYRMSADWSEMRQLHGREFIADTHEPTTGWLDKYIPPDDRALVSRAIAHAIENRQVFQLEHRVLRVDGSIGWTFSRAVPLLDDAGNIVEWFGAAVDVTERKNNEQQLREADRRKDEFLAMLGHELRNPLAAIRSGTELLRLLAESDERLLRVHGVLERQSTQMARLIDGLLEISRIARGKIQLENAGIDLRAVLASVVEDRARQLEAKGLELSTSYPEAPLWVWADRVRLAQVFDNLLVNALKFTPAPGRIEVGLVREGADALVRVRDTGVGIRPDMLARMFQPFQQDEQDIARAAGGLGLGLALARGLIELHGGSIEAHSDGPGTGAEFRVRLPLGAPPSERAESSPRLASISRRLLVVEDNADAAETLRSLLALRGHDVAVVPTGTEALERLRSQRADVVLCDLGLPSMSGYDVARAVRADPALCDIHLVAITGYGQPEDRRRSAEAGFDTHLVKPVDIAALDKLLARLPARARAPER